jgi:hypothetical protein
MTSIFYRRRPVTTVFRARQWTPETDLQELARWCDGYVYTGTQHGHTTPPWAEHSCLNMNVSDASPKGYADPGDWIVIVAEDPDGDTYEVLSPAEFAARYETIDGELSAYTVVTRPGTVIEDGEQHIREDRVLQIIRNLPRGEQLTVIREES